MIAIDTNVLVYSVDVSEPAKMAVADSIIKDLGSKGSGVLLWQVACEFLACLNRWENQGRITAIQTEAYFQSVSALFPVVTPVPAMLSSVLDLKRRYSLSYWDGLLIAGCQAAGVSELYSEDLSSGVSYDGVNVINPFGP
ncbi:MAG: PIN domain-containing protein [Pirellulaceae bacterium]